MEDPIVASFGVRELSVDDPTMLTCIWKELTEMKSGMYTKVDKVTSLVEQKLAEHDDRLNKLEKHQDKQWERIDTLYDADVARRRDVLKIVAQRESDAEMLKSLSARVSQLEQQLTATQQQGELIQRTQHDDYSRAFSRSADFETVFLFLLTFGYNTTTGQTCVVFKELEGTLCVCINFRALHVIAKLKLNYAQVTKAGKLPSFTLFRLNVLQKLFREAKLPEKDLDKKQVDSLYERLSVKPMKTPAAKRSSWIALEAEPFAFAANNLMLADKLSDFSNLFSRYYPSNLPVKELTARDNCYTAQDTEGIESEKTPVFQVPYWGELFYKSMKDYRKLLNPDDPLEEHCHFLTLYILDSDASIEDTFEEALASNKRSVQETQPSEETHQEEEAAPRVFKRRRSTQ